MNQSPDQVLMIRPANFGFNTETAGNNTFQKNASDNDDISKKAIEEFDRMVTKMLEHDITVHVVQDVQEPKNPDAIFPNNWLSTHANNVVCTWPMYAKNRRTERRPEIVQHLKELFFVNKLEEFQHFEVNNIYLEGTGSMVLDRVNKIAYACLSDRTHQLAIEHFCQKFNYRPMVFHALNEEGIAIYHTNVLMAIGTDVAVVCSDSILDESKDVVIDSLRNNGKEVVEIDFNQLNSFAGNMLEVRNRNGEPYMLMSSSAYFSLNSNQISTIEKHCKILYFDISTIENIGGGSVRCMLCEIFLDLAPTGV